MLAFALRMELLIFQKLVVVLFFELRHKLVVIFFLMFLFDGFFIDWVFELREGHHVHPHIGILKKLLG